MSHPHVRAYVKRVASIDQEAFPDWNLSKPLPKMPVPELNSTLDKYLNLVRPIVNDEQYEKTKKIVTEFRAEAGIGEKLQKLLIEFAESKDNWCYDWWLDEMYMKVQLPLPVNSNPGMIFKKRNFVDQNSQLKYAAQLISAILDYKTIVDSRSLPIDRARSNRKGQPLCMEQYYRLFTSYRFPGLNKDNLITNSTKLLPEPEHIIVICKNQFFVVDVLLNASRLTDDDLYTQLWRIAKVAEEGEKTAEQVGILTSWKRNKWAASRNKLLEDATNRESLDMIEGSIFILCLDKKPPITFNHQNSIDETRSNQRDDVSMLLQMLHGMGSDLNGGNRWFEKTMQFVIGEDGVCGLNYEHSPSEGIAVVQLVEHTLKYMEELRAMRLHRMQSICDLPYPRKLKWKITEDIKKDINDSRKAIDKLISDLDLYVLRFTTFGKEFPKSQNMSPDSFIQLALQLTYYKIHGHLVSTYESASTRRFRYGRVDNIRAASPAALEWVKSMTGETNVPDEEKMQLLRSAMRTQTEIMTQTILGQGVDCHLMGLRECANENGFTVPDIFADESYKKANHFTLSTSQVPTTMDAIMGYGPVVPDGYGVCYNPHSDYIVAVVTSFKSHSETRSDYFAFTLESSFLQMYELCFKTKDMDTGSDRKIPEEGESKPEGSKNVNTEKSKGTEGKTTEIPKTADAPKTAEAPKTAKSQKSEEVKPFDQAKADEQTKFVGSPKAQKSVDKVPPPRPQPPKPLLKQQSSLSDKRGPPRPPPPQIKAKRQDSESSDKVLAGADRTAAGSFESDTTGDGSENSPRRTKLTRQVKTQNGSQER